MGEQPIFRDSSPLSNSTGFAPVADPSQSILFSVNPSDVFLRNPQAYSPSTSEHPTNSLEDICPDISKSPQAPNTLSYPFSTLSLDHDEASLSQNSSPFSDISSLSASDSGDSIFSRNPSAASSPLSSVSSFSDYQPSPTQQESRLSIPSEPTMESRYLQIWDDSTRPITRSARQELKDTRRQNRTSPFPTRQQRAAATEQNTPDQEPASADAPPSVVIVDENGKRRWPCACGKSFTRDSDRKRHSEESTSCPLVRGKKEQHMKKAIPQFACDLCGKQFSRSDSMDRHRKNPSACQGAPKAPRRQRKGKKSAKQEEDNDDDW
ncbi:hypothetical protein P691DRAFT_451498 [Macrolepiota fuliginosa MF-IS2]|uniref:C2H2-type domain-containing protein n=1 Tax=Macrolepiota fuliginosa MF-IS2 TaxID=1400762 RepID=A0A9P5XH76_9AGAR|nr:hypothetical protein P691DRAFT_451498 [Macrolepiota fuliginosa MF-IS2]